MADNNTQGTGHNDTNKETEEQRKSREQKQGNEKPAHQSDKKDQGNSEERKS